MDFYWSTSPPSFCAPERTSDIDAIVDLISRANQFIYIAVMDYYAAYIYQDKRYIDSLYFNQSIILLSSHTVNPLINALLLFNAPSNKRPPSDLKNETNAPDVY